MAATTVTDWDDMPLDKLDDMVKDRKDHYRMIMDRASWKCNVTEKDLESHNGYMGYVHTAMGCLCYWWDPERTRTIHAHLYPPGEEGVFDRESYVAYVIRHVDRTLWAAEPNHDRVYRDVLPLMLHRIFERDMVLADAHQHRITPEEHARGPFSRKKFRQVPMRVGESIPAPAYVPEVGDVYVYSLDPFPCTASGKTAVLELVTLKVHEPTARWSIEATFQATISFDDGTYVCSKQITVDKAYTNRERLCAEAVFRLSEYWQYVVGALDLEVYKNTPAIGPYGTCDGLGWFKVLMRINLKEKFNEFFQ